MEIPQRLNTHYTVKLMSTLARLKGLATLERYLVNLVRDLADLDGDIATLIGLDMLEV